MSTPKDDIRNQLPEHIVLKNNNDEISRYLKLLKDQRDELALLIEKQETEKKYLKTEMDRLRYKYRLVTKSLNQRIMTRERYNQTIGEAEVLFKKIVVSSGTLLGAVRKDAGALEETINKKVGTEGFKSDNTVPSQLTASQRKALAMAETKGNQPITMTSKQSQSNMDFVFQIQSTDKVAENPENRRSPTLFPKINLFGLGEVESIDYI